METLKATASLYKDGEKYRETVVRSIQDTSIKMTTSRILEGRVAVVTGSSRGLGEGVARSLARKGAKVVLHYSSPSSKVKVEKIASDLKKENNTQSAIVQANLSSTDGPAHLVAETVKCFGQQIDIIVNNAGVSWMASLEECTPESFDEHYYLNVRGPMLIMKAALPHLPRDGSGRVVNISSISSSIGFEQQSEFSLLSFGGTMADSD